MGTFWGVHGAHSEGWGLKTTQDHSQHVQDAKKLDRLDENNGAVAIELTPDDLKKIGAAASQITVQGERYPEKLELMTGR